MRYRDMGETAKRQVRYGAAAMAIVIVAAALIFLIHRMGPTSASGAAEDSASMATTAADARRAVAGVSTSPATAAAVAPSGAATQTTSGDEVTVVNGLRRDDAVALVGEAHRQAALGNYTEAEALLARADKTVPGLPEIREARDDIARLKTPEGQFASHIQRARLAVDHDDGAAAETELSAAAHFRPDAPEIVELRAALKAAHDRKARREARITDALGRMREAIARRDFAAADSALNEAERIDIQEPAIRRARGELARARSARQKTWE
jgi:hypothetical protein